jgi:hypothetical protein
MDIHTAQAPAVDRGDAWHHQPVESLPRSLLAREGRTFVVVALMQRVGQLNRDRRREQAWDPGSQRAWPAGVDVDAPRAELALLARFLDQGHRAQAFWNLVAARRERRRDPVSNHIVSLEAQLLRAFDPAWDTLELDEAALSQACPPWPYIRERLMDATSRLVRRPRLSPFMSWPAVCTELDRWPALEPARRQVVAWAAFSLSSVAWTDWFVREALRRCPELAPELGSTCPGWTDAAAAAQRHTAERVPLDQIADRVLAACAELRERPCSEAVEDLLACARDAQAWLSALPDRRLAAVRALRLAVGEVLGAVRARAAEPGLRWLGDAVLVQIEARWHLAAQGADLSRLSALTLDAAQAQSRLAGAAACCADARQRLQASREALALLDGQEADAAPLMRRRALEQARAEAMRDLLEAGRALPAAEDALLAALSPEAAAFDVAADYVAAWREAQVVPAAPGRPASMATVAAAVSPVPETPPPATAALAGDRAELLVAGP